MKKLFVIAFFITTVSSLYATPDFYDSFNYSPTDVQLVTAATPTWVISSSGGIGPTNTAGSLSYPGLQTATGDNSVLFNGVAPLAGVAERNTSQLYNIGNAPTLYYSLTFRVNTIAANDWGGSGNWLTGSYLLGFNRQLKGTAAPATGDAGASLLIRTGDPNNVSANADSFQGYQLGTSPTAIAAQRTFDSAHVYLPGDTLFLVLSYTFGAGASDDVAKLWVNPVPGTAEGANTPVVATSAGLTDITGSQIQSFFLRNNSVEASRTQIDDLRVGTTWADVTPAAPEPGALALVGTGLLCLISWRGLRRR